MSFSRMTRVASFAAALLSCSLATASASGEWEHEVVYDIQEFHESYSLNLANNAEATMKFCFALTDEASAHGVEEVEESCHADDDDVVSVSASELATQIVSGTTYQLTLDPDSWFSVFNIAFPANGLYAFFSEHAPAEFTFDGGSEFAILKDGETHDVAPAWEMMSTTVATARVVPWKNTMLGCFVVWCVTLSGLVLILNTKVWLTIRPYALMFASGTLMSTSFALILYESTHLITVSDDESLAAGRWTAMIMSGFVTSPVVALCLRLAWPADEEDAVTIKKIEVAIKKDDSCCGHKDDTCCGDTDVDPKQQMKDLEAARAENAKNAKLRTISIDDACCAHADDCDSSLASANVRSRFLMSLIVGDFFHNFTDGVFIGAAFMCNASIAWKIVLVTVGHEIPQELADFAILTNHLGFSTKKALAYNCLSGLSVMFGGIVIMAAEVSSLDTGMLLAYAAGNYLYCATVHMFSQGSKDRFFDAKKLLAFVLGAVAIGLILLDHGHCEAPALDAAAAGADPHGGH